MLRLNQNNLEEYLKKTEAEQIYMKKINSINMSFTSLLTSIQSVFSTYDYQLSTIANSLNVLNINTSNMNLSIGSLSSDLSGVLSNINPLLNSVSTLSINTGILYSSLTDVINSITGGGMDSYNYWREFNKASADIYINYDDNVTIDSVEQLTYSNYLSLRTSNVDKLSYVIQTNIQNDGLTLAQQLDKLGLKLINYSPLSGSVKSLDLVAGAGDAGCDLHNLIVTSIRFYNSGGYFKSLNLPEFAGYNFNGYTMNSNGMLSLTAANNENNFSNMSNLNLKYSCDNTNKTQNFYSMNGCEITFINNNIIRIDPYYLDSQNYTNTVVLESMNNKKLPPCTFGNGVINNYNNNFTFSSLYFNGAKWKINNYNSDKLIFRYCNMRDGSIENYNVADVTADFGNCSQNFHQLNISNFPNVSFYNCIGYTYQTSNYCNIYEVNNFTFNNFTMPSMLLQGTLKNNNNSIKGEFTHLNIDMSANDHTLKLKNYTAGDITMWLKNCNVSGITNTLLNINGNNAKIYGGNYTSLNAYNAVGLNGVNVSDLTIEINNDITNMTFKPWEYVNITNMSFIDNSNMFYKAMLKLNDPFNNVYGLNVSNPNFNEGINDPDVGMLNSGIIQNINYGITSINLKMNVNKVINANWICNCDNVSFIDCRGINPNNILFGGEDRYLFENICKANNDTNVVFTVFVDNDYSLLWKNYTFSSKIKPFSYAASLNRVSISY